MTEPTKVTTAADLEAESTKMVEVKGKHFRIRRVDVGELASFTTRPPKIVKRGEAEEALANDTEWELRLAQSVACAGLHEPAVWMGKPEEKPAEMVLPYQIAPYAIVLARLIMELSDHAPGVIKAATFRDGKRPRSGGGSGRKAVRAASKPSTKTLSR